MSFHAASVGVGDVCPQLRGQEQCCSADYFQNARNQLREQTLLNGFDKQSKSRLDLFRSVAEGIVDCKWRRGWGGGEGAAGGCKLYDIYTNRLNNKQVLQQL